MEKYIITIVDLTEKQKPTTQHVDAEHVDNVINSIFGTKRNVIIENSHVNLTDNYYSFTNGVVRNKPYVFSILCYTSQN